MVPALAHEPAPVVGYVASAVFLYWYSKPDSCALAAPGTRQDRFTVPAEAPVAAAGANGGRNASVVADFGVRSGDEYAYGDEDPVRARMMHE